MAENWIRIHDFQDIKYERTDDGIAKITINRPEVRNAFRPLTVSEMKQALDMARDDGDIGVIVLTGEGPEAFCSGGDQRVRGKGGYIDEKEKIPRLNILDVQKQIRSMPKPVRFLKAAMNADCDGQIGLLDFGGDATLLYYLSEEAQEGRNAYVEKRKPDYKKFPRFP